MVFFFCTVSALLVNRKFFFFAYFASSLSSSWVEINTDLKRAHGLLIMFNIKLQHCLKNDFDIHSFGLEKE